MPKKQSFLLQIWQDQRGLWAVLKDEDCGLLYQFESLEALIQFLSQKVAGPSSSALEPAHTAAKSAIG